MNLNGYMNESAEMYEREHIGRASSFYPIAIGLGIAEKLYLYIIETPSPTPSPPKPSPFVPSSTPDIDAIKK